MTNRRTRKTELAAAETPESTANAAMNAMAECKPVRPKHYRKAAQKAIETNYSAIVSKLVEKAASGSVQHTKLLFDLGRVQEEVEAHSPRRRKSRSLGEILLKEAEKLRRQNEEVADDNTVSKLKGEVSNAQATEGEELS